MMIKFDFLKTILVVLLSISFHLSLSAQCNRMADSLELVKLYNSLDGPNWTNKTNWLVPGKSIDTWYGICVNAKGCVTSIDFFNNKLKGDIYDFNFPELQSLSIYGNQLAGLIPNFDKLPNLYSLDLSSNFLTGTLPNFDKLPNLIELDLYFNQITGLIPNFDKLPNLYSLNLSGNFLTGTLPNFDKLPNIEYLALVGNQLTGTLPNFDKLPNIEYLALDGNQLTGSIPNFDKLPNLNILALEGNQLTGTIPNFNKLTNLEWLYLFDNQLSGCIPDSLKRFCGIYFDFSNNSKLPWKGNFRNFCSGKSQIGAPCNDTDPTTIHDKIDANCNCVGIKGTLDCNAKDSLELVKLFFSLGGQMWEDKTNWLVPGKSIETWYGVTTNDNGCVIAINLSSNNLSREIPNLNLPHLEVLNLSSNYLPGTIPNFDKLPNLNDLDLSWNALTGTIPNFDKLPNLNDLDLSWNALTGTIPNFDKLPNLSDLSLNDNHLAGTIPNFDKLSNLQVLLLAYNNLTGSISNFDNFPYLNRLRLSGNQLTGSIPNFDKLLNLNDLDLFDNQLTGTIPNFDKLPNIEYLVLGDNQLTGTIPNFDKLPKLEELWISNNKLNANIPNFDRCKSLVKLFVNENYFTFEHIKNFTRSISYFSYQPQHKFYKDTSFTQQINQDLSISLEIDSSLSDNSYKWTNNINTSWTMDPSQDIHSNTYIFKNIQTKDAGRYTVKVTNPTLPLLTLESNTISIKVCNVQQDSSELVNLYNGTSGSNWKIKSNWLQSGKPISTWHGISTTADGCVRSINLDNNNLIGSIPPLDLNTLDTLILSNNQLNGNIPEMKIPFIKYINMRNNSLIGAFPAVMHDWMNLGGLDLGQNNLRGPVPPDMGDICELQELKLDNNKIEGELPEELTKLQKLQIGRVDFNNNKIDSLKEKIIFFCPFGDNILDKNPSYNRFLGICNRRCSGTEWNMLKDFPWIADTIGALRCKSDSNCVYTRSEAGFVNVRGIKVVYTQNICCADDQCNDRTVETRFYDCGGKRLETAQCGKSGFCTSFGAISMEEFDRLVYDKKWQCGDTLSITTDIKNIRPKKYLFNNTSQQANCYPNPVNEILTCEIEGKLKKLTVSDLQGKECMIKAIKQNGDQLEIDFSGLPSGIYFMELWTDSGRSYRKVIKGE